MWPNKGVNMSLEECKGATGAANPEAIAALLDGNGELAAALVVPEKDTQALIDLARYQHQVLSEIARAFVCAGLFGAGHPGAAMVLSLIYKSN